MIEYEGKNPHRVGHFLKVYGYAKTIGELEGLPPETQFILETASIVHDIGIKQSLLKYGCSIGSYQEKEGVVPAKEMLKSLKFADDVIERVCFLIAHHHTYSKVDGLDYQILLEADFLVNMLEEEMSQEAILSAFIKIFKTEAGKRFCKQLYLS
jgi:HD superfamily phosphodiesterase